MAYVFVSAIALRKNPVDGWVNIDPSTFTLDYLISTYSNIYVTLSNSFESGNIIYEVVRGRIRYTNTSLTFAQWLTANGNAVLPSVGSSYSTQKAFCNSGNVAQYDYRSRKVHPTFHPDMEVEETDKTDLLLTKTGVDYLVEGKCALVSVNGFLHKVEQSSHGFYVKDAVKTKDIGKDAIVGMLSFVNVDEMEVISFTDDMIFKTKPEQTLYAETYINIGVPTTGKTVLLSIGGYLHALDDAYQETGDGIIRIDWTRIPLPERLYESMDNIDMSSMLSILYQNGMSNIDALQMRSDAALRAYLLLSQSFAVVVNRDYLVVKRTPIPKSTFPGIYTVYQEPKGFLVTETGRILTTHIVRDKHLWNLYTHPIYTTNATYQTTDWTTNPIITLIHDPSMNVEVTRAFQIEISREDIMFS